VRKPHFSIHENMGFFTSATERGRLQCPRNPVSFASLHVDLGILWVPGDEGIGLMPKVKVTLAAPSAHENPHSPPFFKGGDHFQSFFNPPYHKGGAGGI